MQDKLAKRRNPGGSVPAWMNGFGKLRRLRKESARVQRRIDAAFEVIEPEDRE